MNNIYFIIAVTCAIITGILSFVLTDKLSKHVRIIIKMLISIFFCGATWSGIINIANTFDVSYSVLFESKHLSILIISCVAAILSCVILLFIAERFCAVIVHFIKKKKNADSDIDIDIQITSVFTVLFIGCLFINACFATVLIAAIATALITLWIAWVSD